LTEGLPISILGSQTMWARQSMLCIPLSEAHWDTAATFNEEKLELTR